MISKKCLIIGISLGIGSVVILLILGLIPIYMRRHRDNSTTILCTQQTSTVRQTPSTSTPEDSIEIDVTEKTIEIINSTTSSNKLTRETMNRSTISTSTTTGTKPSTTTSEEPTTTTISTTKNSNTKPIDNIHTIISTTEDSNLTTTISSDLLTADTSIDANVTNTLEGILNIMFFFVNLLLSYSLYIQYDL